MENERVFLRVSEAANLLDICTSRVYQLIAAGLLPGIKRGRRTLIPRQAFDAYIEQVNQEALSNLNLHPLKTEAGH